MVIDCPGFRRGLNLKAILFGNEFNRLIEGVKRFVSKDDSHPANTWIKLEVRASSGTIKAIGIDSYRLATETVICSDIDEDFDVFVRPNIKKMPKGDIVKITRNENKAYIECSGNIFGFRQPEINFMDHESILSGLIKDDPVYEIKFDAKLMYEALQSIPADDFNKRVVVLELHGPLEPVILRHAKESIKLVLPMRNRK
jgi:DNA polymerase III sliding clamp (beta) subunit (PCNA family)